MFGACDYDRDSEKDGRLWAWDSRWWYHCPGAMLIFISHEYHLNFKKEEEARR